MTHKVLLVDDEQPVLDGVSRRIGFDYDLTTAKSGAEGLQAIQESGPFAVVVTDMRMPHMNGIEFVTQARRIDPDTVYLMLTGNQDQETATRAVNEGQVFRFLNKPCDVKTLRAALEAGLRQYELVTAERELLRKTFYGAVEVLTDVWEGSNPEFVGCSVSFEETVSKLTHWLGIEDRWEYHVASKFGLIGFSLLRESDREAYLGVSIDDPYWDRTLLTASGVGKRLIQRIPRLEPVAAMIGGQTRVDGSSPWLPPTDRKQIEAAGATLLRLSAQVERLVTWGVDAEEGIRVIRASLPALSSELEVALRRAWPTTPTAETHEVAFGDLTEAMVAAEDVLFAGTKLVCKGRRLTSTVIEKLRCHEERRAIRGRLLVYGCEGQRVESRATPAPECEAPTPL